jgi:hypothetical protein
MDLDIEYCGKVLTEIYERYENNFALIAEKLSESGA